MALNYDEAIAELRAEEKRLEAELEQIRAAIPGMVVLRNRNRGMSPSTLVLESVPVPPARNGRFAGWGPTRAIPEVLKETTDALTTREIYDRLAAEGWATSAQKPIGVISATMIQLEKQGIAQRVGEAWKMKVNLERVPFTVPHHGPPTEQQQPS